MTPPQALGFAETLVERSRSAMLAALDPEGFPSVRALSKIAARGIEEVWFVTRASSRHVANLRRDARCCVYFVDPPKYQGLSLLGRIEILQDEDTRHRLWRDSFQGMFTGRDDPEYSVLHFIARTANLRWGSVSTDFDVK